MVEARYAVRREIGLRPQDPSRRRRERRWDEAAGLSLDVVAYAAPQEHTRAQRRREERPAMDHIGIDVHKRESQICILAEGGELIEQRIRTEPERFTAVLGDRPRARIVMEASTDSEWVAPCLEALGHEVIVADPNFAPMYDVPVPLHRRQRLHHRPDHPRQRRGGRVLTGQVDRA